MLQRMPWQAIACLTTGVVLGLWMARADVPVTPLTHADDSTPVLRAEESPRRSGLLSCCDSPESGPTQLALATTPALLASHNAAVLQKGEAAGKKPNILIIWGDDIGQFNVSAYNLGMMGFKTPNIDRIAREGALFTDWYGQQSCTAGRAAFITGQSPIRTGLTKVGLPGAPEGMKPEDPTIATLLRARGYVTGQFGKNHLG
ncbi:MAG: sulfatase-like hydrolase/transferase, partial [Planctomycetaceae bacterium]